MQKKHLRILATATCLSAGLAFSAYGEEVISSVPLSFSWDGAPKGGEMRSEEHTSELHHRT